MLITLFWFLLTLLILVTVHEFGHFIVARWCGVKVLRFSIGFGKPLLSHRDQQGTEFVVASIPLGGYVKMLDEREDTVPKDQLPLAFTQKTVWQRMAIVSAGPIANFILAIVFYYVLAISGAKGIAPVVGEVEPNSMAENMGFHAGDEILSVDGKGTVTWTQVYEQLTKRIGDTGLIEFAVKPYSPMNDASELSRNVSSPITQWLGHTERPDVMAALGLNQVEPVTEWKILSILPDSAAEEAGLQEGDQLLQVNGKPLGTLRRWIELIQGQANLPIKLEFIRDGKLYSELVTPKPITQEGKIVGQIGISLDVSWPEGLIRSVQFGPIQAVSQALAKTWEQIATILSFLKKLLLLDVSISHLGGSFTIAQVAEQTAVSGWKQYLSFLAFFSISLGVFNLLPIPVLDGGHLFFYGYEAIRGKAVSEKFQMIAFQVGLFIVLGLMVIAHYNDLVRLF